MAVSQELLSCTTSPPDLENFDLNNLNSRNPLDSRSDTFLHLLFYRQVAFRPTQLKHLLRWHTNPGISAKCRCVNYLAMKMDQSTLIIKISLLIL